jgi:RNA polymerase sigma-70 factor (ECF subfamily)
LDEFQRELVDLLPRMRRFARVLTGASHDADDLVQTAVERALARRDQWRPGTSLKSWVFTMMRNAWIDEARARKRRGVLVQDPEYLEAAPDPASPDLETRRQAQGVREALAGLPEAQRIAVALVLVEGQSYAEAAEVLKVPVGTLTSRLVRGRLALMERLGEETRA